MDIVSIISALTIVLTGLSSWQVGVDKTELRNERRFWLAACVAIASGLLIESLASMTDDTQGYSLGAACIFLGILLQATVLLRFLKRRLRYYAVIAAGLWLLQLFGLVIFPQLTAWLGRHVLIVDTIIFCILFAWMAYLYRQIELNLGVRWPGLFPILYGLAALMFLVRIGSYLLGQDAESALVMVLETMLYVSAATANIYGGFGFLIILLRQKNSHLARQAQVDGLTGAVNRRGLALILSQLEHHPRRLPICIVMLDIDFFKKINDQFGHPAGDAVLKNLVAFLQQGLREQDVVARYGGEEFCLILQNANFPDVCRRIHALRERFAQGTWLVEVPDWRCTFSAGMAVHRGDSALDAVLAEADQYLYQAKQAGRNCLFTAEGEWQN